MLAEWVEPFNQVLTSIGLAMPRIMVCFLILPALSQRFLHGLLRTSVSIGIALPVATGIFYQVELTDLHFFSLIGLLLKEAAVGIILGFLLALPFWLFESIGTIFDTQRGALMGEQLNPETGSMTSISGVLLLQSAIVLMIEIGAFAWIFGLIVNSYVLWPALQWLPPFSDDAYTLLSSEFSLMAMRFVLYALPLMMTLLIIEMIFALIGLYAPQLQVYFLAMPIKSLCGIIILVLMAGLLWQYGTEEFLRFQDGHHLLQSLAQPFLSEAP
ncbi:MAG: type III secretion system export apparatus subunit SctT [Oleiphilaceae bacterium]|nr:type III secretion system export apparatus subunit SctT [Oleiphilaceae bacterium]